MITNKFHAGFIAPDVIPVHNVSQLKDLYLDDKSHQLKNRELGVGKYYLPILQVCLKDKETNFWLNVLGNETLILLSYLSYNEIVFFKLL